MCVFLISRILSKSKQNSKKCRKRHTNSPKLKNPTKLTNSQKIQKIFTLKNLIFSNSVFRIIDEMCNSNPKIFKKFEQNFIQLLRTHRHPRNTSFYKKKYIQKIYSYEYLISLNLSTFETYKTFENFFKNLKK